MAKIYVGRHTACPEEPVAVFLIGMRVNRLLALHKWLPVFAAIRPMLRELARFPEKGLLHSRVFWSGRTLLAVQYWRSFDDLERFARNPTDPHLPAWRRYNQCIGKSDVVGVFHETYPVQPGRVDAIYANMPAFGLGAATRLAPINAQSETARRQFRAQSQAPGEAS